MPLIGVRRALVSSKVAYDPATTKWISAVNTLAGSSVVGPTNAGIVNTLIKSLKTDPSGNLFASANRLWLLALANESQYEAQVDIINLQTWTGHGGYTLDSNGFTGNGSTGYLDTNFIPNTNGGSTFISSSAALSVGIFNSRLTNATGYCHLGTNDNAGGNNGTETLSAMAFGDAGFWQINQQPFTAAAGTITTTKGFWLGTFVGTTTTAYYNKVAQGAGSGPGGLAHDSLFIGGLNQGGSTSFGTIDQIVSVHIGGGLTFTQQANFTTAVNAALGALGRNVF